MNAKKLIWLTLFSIAMGFMETAVVVYLRKIYYPNGFQFPLIPIEADIALVEFLREAATIIMLLGIGLLTGKTPAQKFAFFIYCFAIWDLCYYLFLKLLLNWPESLFTWDILFLIPVPWVGPVIAPCIVSMTMILFALSIFYYSERKVDATIKPNVWFVFILGSIIVILSFMWDYIRYINQANAKPAWTLSHKDAMFTEIVNYVPTTYNWWLFGLGELIIIYGIVTYIKKIKNG